MKKREKIYIIPTEYGFMYGAGILTSLIGGVVYNNNLAFLLCFFLMALFLMGMVHTHNNLRRIGIESLNIFLSPSDSVGHGVIWIKSHNSEGHSQIRITCKDNDDEFNVLVGTIYKNSLQPHYFDFNTGSWGKKSISKIRLSTRYPFGFFYVWRNIEVPTDYYVYPQPSGNQNIDDAQMSGNEESRSHHLYGDDFSEHKKYMYGDSQKHIDWKAYARGRPLLTKKFNEGERQTFLIDYARTKGNQERRMRQMSLWVHQCSEEQVSYSMKIGERQIPPGHGEKHKFNCLRMIAGSREAG